MGGDAVEASKGNHLIKVIRHYYHPGSMTGDVAPPKKPSAETMEQLYFQNVIQKMWQKMEVSSQLGLSLELFKKNKGSGLD